MKNKLNRRSFLKRVTLAAGTLPAVRFFSGPNLLAADAGKKLNCVLIGCGGRGMNHLEQLVIENQNLVAIVDPHENKHAAVKKYLASKGVNAANLSTKGYGEAKPVADNKTKEGRRMNRRVEFIVVYGQ